MTEATLVYDGPNGDFGVIPADDFGQRVTELAAKLHAAPKDATRAVLDVRADASPALATMIIRGAVHLWIDRLVEDMSPLHLRAASNALPGIVLAYRAVRPVEHTAPALDPTIAADPDA